MSQHAIVIEGDGSTNYSAYAPDLPGVVATGDTLEECEDLAEAYRWLGSQVRLVRIGAPEEVASWITLLLSSLASFMTGAVIPLDGGKVIDRE